MREIKFRCWIIEDKKYLTDSKPPVPELTNNWAYRKGEYILEQYTGLKDMYEQEIYEGDILEICTNENIFWEPNNFDFVKVVFESGCFIIQNERLSSTDKNGWIFHTIENKKIIGNVNEKPYLTKD